MNFAIVLNKTLAIRNANYFFSALKLILFARRKKLEITLFTIEAHIFGHLMLEHAELVSRVSKSSSENKRYWSTFYGTPCNELLVRMLRKDLLQRGVLVIDNYEILRLVLRIDQFVANRFNRPRRVFQSKDVNLSHKRATELSATITIPSVQRAEVDSFISNGKLSISVMNRTSKYKKIGEEGRIYSHRNFEFEVFYPTIRRMKNDVIFFRLGTHNKDESRVLGEDLTNLIEFGQRLSIDPSLDLAIMSNVQGFFGADTGPAWLFLLRRIPVALVNEIPLYQPAPTDFLKLMVLPKLLWSTEDKRLLSIGEMLDIDPPKMQFTEDFRKAGLEVIDNTADEVAEFFEEWKSIVIDKAGLYDIEFMDWIRARYGVQNLASISMTFIHSRKKDLRV